MKGAALIAGLLAAIAGMDGRAAGASPPADASGKRAAASGKLAELEDILRSRNDNDPRLDRDFGALSTNDKRLFRKKYAEIPPEKRNERGTIVYLLGKNLKTHEDWEFFRRVALEPPCLSLSDCSTKPAPGSDEEAMGDEVTLAYPSLAALRQARRAVETGRAGPAAQTAGAKANEAEANEAEAFDLFAAAKKSKTRAVARMAASLEKKLENR